MLRNLDQERDDDEKRVLSEEGRSQRRQATRHPMPQRSRLSVIALGFGLAEFSKVGLWG